MKSISAVNLTHSSVDYVGDFSRIFNGVSGSLHGGNIDLGLETNAEVVVRPSRSVLEALKAIVKSELNRLEGSGILQTVGQPTNWVNQISVVRKHSGEVRIGLDPRLLNTALKCD
ncbi:hypothetical protein LSH36_132g04025 [Paralvinella palmiformis]|uniref:Uncharacterized protein n=1 Tax=Paralvinella palmiformis TaxID=53620 RepID=A0AAD9N891_9ANNE|nr:hypothetical protein LSH36_132g04025 [Paralvinella palmiformis]